MADEIDHANSLAEREVDSILKNRGAIFVGESLKNCLECDEPIPEKRRQLLKGCTLCVECQELRERRSKQ